MSRKGPFCDGRKRPLADIRLLAHAIRMGLPKATFREFRQAVDDAQPLWVKFYLCGVGLPAWAFLAYRLISDDDPTGGALGKAALATFSSAVVLQLVTLFRAFWRNDL